MIYKSKEDGSCTISSYQTWRPGVYEDERTARYAFRFRDEQLTALQNEANTRSGGQGGTITFGDLTRLASKGKP